MATTAKLVTDLTVTLRGIRSHEGVIAAHLAQAASDGVTRQLRDTKTRERAVADRVARALHGLGAPAPRIRPGWVPSPTSFVVAAATQTQPLGEALVTEAAVVRMLADRARVVHGLATALGATEVVRAADEVSGLYDDYAGWLVSTAARLVVDEDDADLVPTLSQRLAGRAKDAVGAPARVRGRVTDRAQRLVGVGTAGR